jgi:hypothetical protein
MPVKVYDGTNWVTVAGDGQQGPAATSSSISTWVKTASGGETSVSGTGDTGYGTLAYTVGQELVYLNGVLLDRGDDYTATNGTTIAGLTALVAGDVVTVWTVNSFSVANTYTQAQSDARYPAKAGSVLQVVSTNKTDTFSTTSTSFVDVTGLSLSITPSSATSKILVFANVQGNGTVSSAAPLHRLMRDSTAIAIGDAASNRSRVTGQFFTTEPSAMNAASMAFLDSPATTSAVTYKIQMLSNSGGTVYINRSATDTDSFAFGRGISTITVMEIGA